jgi:hypothetical protein
MSACWVLQEVAVKGQDIAFKDVIEPLESVSVSIIKTDKASLEELGSPDEVQPLLYLLQFTLVSCSLLQALHVA